MDVEVGEVSNEGEDDIYIYIYIYMIQSKTDDGKTSVVISPFLLFSFFFFFPSITFFPSYFDKKKKTNF